MAGRPPPSTASHRRATSNVVTTPTGRGTSIKSGGSKASAPVSLTRRLLFPYLPLSTPIPPILATTSEHTPGIEALNAEIYDFLALAMRGFVNPWWTKITARDRDFIVEINRVVTHVVRSLEVRLVGADLVGMLVHDLPLLVAQHYSDYRTVEAKVRSGYATGLQGSVDPYAQLFHGLQPHLAVFPDGTVNGTYIRQAVEHIMKVSLPPEDWAAETERSIVCEIVVKIVLGSAIPKLKQPWFAHKILLEVLGPPKSSSSLSASVIADTRPRNSFSAHHLIILFLSALQTISTLALAFIAFVQSTVHIVQQVNGSDRPSRRSQNLLTDLAGPPLAMVAEILTLRERAATNAILTIAQACAGFLRTFIDRFVPFMLQAQITAPRITQVVATSKRVLFPNGYPSPPPIDPTPEEQVIMREQLETRLLDLLSPSAAKVIFGPTIASRRRTVKAILDPLNSPACNTHLLILILDLILATVFPELVQSAAQSATPEKDSSRETDRWPSPPNGTPSIGDDDSIMGDDPHTKERERSEGG